MATSQVRMFSLINVAPEGLVVTRIPEELNPKYYDEPRIAELFHKFHGQCLGLKIRLSKELVGDLGSKPLEATLKIAERLKCPVVVHTTNPPIPPAEIAGMLRPGDVYCHVFQGIRRHRLSWPDGKVCSLNPGDARSGVEYYLTLRMGGRIFHSKCMQKQAIWRTVLNPDIIGSDAHES